MEFYEDKNSLFAIPAPDDNSLDLAHIVKLFSTRAQSYCTSSCNSNLFVFRAHWLCICPSGELYRLVGRCPSISPKIIKRCADYDVYCRGELGYCRDVFCEIVQKIIQCAYELR